MMEELPVRMGHQLTLNKLLPLYTHSPSLLHIKWVGEALGLAPTELPENGK